MIKVILSIIMLLFCNPVWSATRVVDMVENSNPTRDDITYCADGGTLDRRCQLGDIAELSGFLKEDTNVKLSVITDNVGIGTIYPDEKLHVDGNIRANGSVIATTLYGDGSNITGLPNSGWSDLGTEVALTTPTDNVGIGTSNPAGKLHVAGGSLVVEGDFSGVLLDNSMKIDGNTSRKLTFSQTNGTFDENVRLDMDTTSNTLSIDSTTALNHVVFDGMDVTADAFVGDGSGLTGILTAGGWNDDGMNTYASPITDNVAIGTITPTQKLTVVGTVSATAFIGDGSGLTGIPSGNITINTTSPMIGAGTGTTFTLGVDQSKLTLSSIGGAVTDSQVPDNITITETDPQVGTLTNTKYCTTDGSVVNCTTDAPSGSGTVNSGGADLVAIYDTAGTAVSASSVLSDNGTNIGIGTVGPVSKLQVNGTVTATAFSGDGSGLTGLPSGGGWTDGGTNVYTTTTTDNVGIGTTTPSTTLEIVKQGSQSPLMVSATATGDGDYLIVSSSGNIGIGTTTPANALDIQSTLTTARVVSTTTGGASSGGAFTVLAKTGAAMTADQRLGAFFFGGSKSTANDVYSAASLEGYGEGTWSGTSGPSRFAFYTTPASTLVRTERMRIDSTGNIGVGTYYPNGRLTVFGSSTGAVPIQTWKDSGNTQRMVVFGNGTVGIGTAAPSTTLDVNGTATMTGFKMPTSPTNGYVLTSDANGVGTWQATGSGSSGWTDGGTNIYTTTTTDTVGIGTTTASTTLEIVKQSSSAPLMVSSTATGDGDVLIITSGGNVGIGTLLPRGPLDLGPTGTIYTQTITGPTGPTVLGMSNNVGIGTITAGSLLTVGSTGQVTVSSAGAVATSSTLSVADDAYAAGWNGSTNVPTKNAVYDKIETLGAGYWTDAGVFLYATTTTDNVGIGTVAPSQRLEIRGSVASNLSGQIVNSNASGVASFIAQNDTGKSAQLVCTGGSYAVPNLCGIIATTGDNFTIAEADGTQNVTISGTGNVGIGSTAPNGSLDIRNTASAVGWTVQTGANTACNTTCTSACVFGQDTGTSNGPIVNCSDASADRCLCAGSN